MTVVYLDQLFILNGVVDYLLLLAAGKISGEVLNRRRMVLSSLIGGFYAGAVLVPAWAFLNAPLCRICISELMVLVAYCSSRHLLRVTIVFYLVTAVFGGGIFALALMGKHTLTLHHGILYSAMDMRMMMLSAAVCYAVITLALKRAAKHLTITGEVQPGELILEDRRIRVQVLMDTGNTLSDPVTGNPVIVVDSEKVAGLFPTGEAPQKSCLTDPVTVFEALSHGRMRDRFRLLPYRAVGVDCGLLLAFRLDRAVIGGRDYGCILAALSPNPVSDGGSYQALIGI